MSITIDYVTELVTPTLINNSGEIAAVAIVNQATTVALWHYGGAETDFLTPSSINTTVIYINGFNASDQMVGQDFTSGAETALTWQNGNGTILPPWSGDILAGATGLNDFGVIIGFSRSETTTTNPIHTSYGPLHALVWTSGVASLLSPLEGDSGAVANAINDSALVVGQSISTTAAADGSYPSHAVVWTNGVVSSLATVSGAQSSAAWFVNSGGDIAGEVTLTDDTTHGVLWHKGIAAELGSLTGYNWSQPTAMNDLGQVIGIVSTNDSFDSYLGGVQHAVLWQNGTVTDLNSLLPANDGIVLEGASSINDAGEIIAYGTSGGNSATFVLDLNGPQLGTVSTAASVVHAIQQETVANPVTFADNAVDIAANLDALQTLAASGKLGTILIADSTTPTFTLTDMQLVADAGVLSRISGNFVMQTPSATIDGFSGAASQYSVSVSNGTVTVSGNGLTEHLSNVFALQFADQRDIVAATPGNGTVTTGNVTELYAAVLDREPDVAGLAYYQNYLKANPNTSFVQFAEWFLSSPEYTGNPAHSYAQTSAGDAQFIKDSYQNLLHRTPSDAEVGYYQSNVMAAALANLTPGTTAYASAEFQAHAQMLVYFSASPEFLTDVQITAAHPADAQHWLVLT